MLPLLILALFPQSDLDAALQTAETLAANQNFGGAVAALREAGAEDVDDPNVLGTLGRYLLRDTEARIASGAISGFEINDAFQDAAWILKKACDLPGALETHFENWSEAELNAGDAELALKPVEAGLEIYSKSAPLFLQKARVLGAMARDSSEGGNEERATELKSLAWDALNAAAQANPSLAAPWVRMGEQKILESHAVAPDAKDSTKHASDLRQQGIDCWVQAIERDAAGVDLGATVLWLQADAGPVIELVIEKLGDDATRWWFCGSAYFAGEPMDWPKVRDAFKKVLELNPQFLNAHYYLGQGAMREGTRLKKAGENRRAGKAFYVAAKYMGLYINNFGPSYLASAQAASDSGASMVANAKWLAAQGVMNADFETAISLMRFATQAAPEDVEAWNNLGFFHREAGQAAQAEQAYAKAAELAPQDPQILNDWAVIYHYYLKTEDAKALGLYEQAIDLATQLIEKGGMSPEETNRIKTSLRDATVNQKKLKAGNRRNG